MTQLLDQTNDSGFCELHRYAKLYTLPDFVKTAEANDVCTPDENLPQYFADVREPRQFPCHNKAATYVSWMYYLNKQSYINPKISSKIKDRLEKFAAYWGINNAVKELREKHAQLNATVDTPDSSYAYVWVSANGDKERHYPLRNATETKVAAEWFCDHYNQLREQYSFTDRQTIARKILEKAAQYGASVADQYEQLEKAAGYGVCDPKKAAQVIRDRIKVAKKVKPDCGVVMLKLAESFEGNPTVFLDRAITSDLAQTIDQFDRTHGLINKYSEAIPSPEDTLFSATFSKIAECRDDLCETVTGAVYSKSDFDKLSASEIQDVFGDEIAESVTTGLSIDPEKMATIVSTLPRPDAAMLDEIMSSKGIFPITKTAADTSVGFTFEQLERMAAI